MSVLRQMTRRDESDSTRVCGVRVPMKQDVKKESLSSLCKRLRSYDMLLRNPHEANKTYLSRLEKIASCIFSWKKKSTKEDSTVDHVLKAVCGRRQVKVYQAILSFNSETIRLQREKHGCKSRKERHRQLEDSWSKRVDQFLSSIRQSVVEESYVKEKCVVPTSSAVSLNATTCKLDDTEFDVYADFDVKSVFEKYEIANITFRYWTASKEPSTMRDRRDLLLELHSCIRNDSKESKKTKRVKTLTQKRFRDLRQRILDFEIDTFVSVERHVGDKKVLPPRENRYELLENLTREQVKSKYSIVDHPKHLWSKIFASGMSVTGVGANNTFACDQALLQAEKHRIKTQVLTGNLEKHREKMKKTPCDDVWRVDMPVNTDSVPVLSIEVHGTDKPIEGHSLKNNTDTEMKVSITKLNLDCGVCLCRGAGRGYKNQKEEIHARLELLSASKSSELRLRLPPKSEMSITTVSLYKSYETLETVITFKCNKELKHVRTSYDGVYKKTESEKYKDEKGHVESFLTDSKNVETFLEAVKEKNNSKTLKFLKHASKAKIGSILRGVTGMTRPVSEQECGADKKLDLQKLLQDRYGVPLYSSLGSKIFWKYLRIFRFVSEDDLPEWREALGSECPRMGVEDTGVRSMCTVLDIYNGCVWSLGVGFPIDFERNISMKLDNLQSMIDLETSTQEQEKLRKIQFKTRERGKRKRRAFHRTASDILTKLFSVLIRPPFETSKMMRRRGRISARVTRRMKCISHYKFKETLERFASQRDMEIFVSSEVYSTKLCGSCTFLHKAIGGNKMFRCPHCKTCEHRGKYLASISLSVSRFDVQRRNILSSYTQMVEHVERFFCVGSTKS